MLEDGGKRRKGNQEDMRNERNKDAQQPQEDEAAGSQDPRGSRHYRTRMSEENEEERVDKYIRTEEIERGSRKKDAGDNEDGEAKRKKSD